MVADLMDGVLRPLAEQRGLLSWDDISDYAAGLWFPARIAFGKFKGRPFREALEDPDLHAWLKKQNTPVSTTAYRWSSPNCSHCCGPNTKDATRCV